MTMTTFGALQYPEWRLDVVKRAKIAGMGYVGRPMEWRLWGKLSCDVVTEDKNQISPMKGWRPKRMGSKEISQEDRKGGKRKRARENVYDGYDSDISGGEDGEDGAGDGSVASHGLGFRDKSPDNADGDDDTSSGEESSEAEWQGWMGDLHRQRKAYKAEHEKLWQQEMNTTDQASSVLFENLSMESHASSWAPLRHVDNQQRWQEERRAMEPSAVAVSLFSGPVWGSPAAATQGVRQTANLSPGHRQSFISTPLASTLSSPSSMESIAYSPPRVLGSAFDPTSPSSSATSPAHSVSHHGHSQSTSTSSPFLPSFQPAARGGVPGTSLYHSTSMYDYGGLRSGPSDGPDPPPRRPSMPIISTRQILPVPSETGDSSFPQPRSIPDSDFAASYPVANSSFSGNNILPTNVGSLSLTPPSSGKTITTISVGSTPVSRRASSAGLGVGGGSVGRRSSVLVKGANLLRKKDAAGEREKEKEKRSKEKGKEKVKEEDPKSVSKESTRQSQRPKLSLSTSSGSHHSLFDANRLQQPKSPTFSNSSKTVRHVKSGPSIMSGGEEDNIIPSSPNGLSVSPKKRSELSQNMSKRGAR